MRWKCRECKVFSSKCWTAQVMKLPTFRRFINVQRLGSRRPSRKVQCQSGLFGFHPIDAWREICYVIQHADNAYAFRRGCECGWHHQRSIRVSETTRDHQRPPRLSWNGNLLDQFLHFSRPLPSSYPDPVYPPFAFDFSGSHTLPALPPLP